MSFDAAVKSWSKKFIVLGSRYLCSELCVRCRFAQGDTFWGIGHRYDGAAIPAATVVVRSVETGTERTMTPMRRAVSMPQSVRWSVRNCCLQGRFCNEPQNTVYFSVGQRQEVNLQLQVGDIHQTSRFPAILDRANNNGSIPPRRRAAGEDLPLMAKLRSVTHAESGNRQLHSQRQEFGLKLRGRQYVSFGRRLKKLFIEWRRVHERLGN